MLSFFPLDVLDGILDVNESVSEDFLPTHTIQGAWLTKAGFCGTLCAICMILIQTRGYICQEIFGYLTVSNYVYRRIKVMIYVTYKNLNKITKN